MISSIATASSYASQEREEKLKRLPSMALNGLDVYAGLAGTIPHLAATPQSVMALGTGGLAAWHGVCCIYHLKTASEKGEQGDTSAQLRQQTMAIGDFITGVGFVGVTAGMGVWALPLVGIGMLTTNFARFR